MKLMTKPIAAWWLVSWWSMCRTLVGLATPMGVVAFVGSASTPPICPRTTRTTPFHPCRRRSNALVSHTPTRLLVVSSSSSSSARPRSVRIPPSNPEEVEAARNGNWNYDTGCISNNEDTKKDNNDEINYGDEELEKE